MYQVRKQPYSIIAVVSLTIPEFKYRKDWRYIKYAYRSRSADPKAADEIAAKRGVRWSVLNELPNWFPSSNSVIDFMHCVYLCKCCLFRAVVFYVYATPGMVKHISSVILLKHGMFNPRPASNCYPLNRLDAFYASIIWPSSVTRPPKTVCPIALFQVCDLITLSDLSRYQFYES